MIAKGNLKIGQSAFQFEVEEKDDKEALLKVIALASPRTNCNLCDTHGLETKHLEARKVTTEKGTFVYISVVCKCGAKSTLGEYKTGGYFWKEYEKYDPENGNGKKEEVTKNEVDIDEVDF